MNADQIQAWALVLTAIGTITTPAIIAYFAQRGRNDLRQESEKNLDATAAVKQEVVTGNEQTLGQLGMRVETRRAEDIPHDERTAQEQRHVDADPLSKQEGK